MSYSKTEYFAKKFYLSPSLHLVEHNFHAMDFFSVFPSADASNPPVASHLQQRECELVLREHSYIIPLHFNKKLMCIFLLKKTFVVLRTSLANLNFFEEELFVSWYINCIADTKMKQWVTNASPKCIAICFKL